MQTANIFSRLFSEFGVLGCIEVSAACVVAIGCVWELWIILNKLTRHVERVGKTAGMFWRALAWTDATLRPIAVRLKIGGRKLPEVKEQLLERLFVMLVALGVGIEFICLFFSLHEIAVLNKEAAQARKEAGEAIRAAESEKFERVKLEAIVSPRSLGLDQQKQMSDALRQFAGRKVNVSSYGLDLESVGIAGQIISVLSNAGINVVDSRASSLVSGGFEIGINVRGPANEQDFVEAIGKIIAAAQLQVSVNAASFRPGANLSGGATLSGAATVSAGGATGLPGPTAPGTEVSITVGIKPIKTIHE